MLSDYFSPQPAGVIVHEVSKQKKLQQNGQCPMQKKPKQVKALQMIGD